MMSENNINIASGIYGHVDGSISILKESPNGYMYGYRSMELSELTDSMVKVDAVGAGCLMVHRDVYEDSYIRTGKNRKWFYESLSNSGVFGEDISFCQRVVEHGFDIYCLPSVRVKHYKFDKF